MICPSFPPSHQLWLTATCIACICISIYTLYRVNVLEQSVVECMLSQFHEDHSNYQALSSEHGLNEFITSDNQPHPSSPIHMVNMVNLTSTDEAAINAIFASGDDIKPSSAAMVTIEEDIEDQPQVEVEVEVPSPSSIDESSIEIKHRTSQPNPIGDGAQSLHSMRIAELKTMAKTMGIDAKGTKAELVAAIEAASA